MTPPRIKVAIIGDGGVGKTSMCVRLVDNKFSSVYVPTCFEAKPFSMTLLGRDYELTILDTAGQEDYDKLRKTLAYDSNPHVIVVCYAINNEKSYDNVRNYWYPEIRQFASRASIVLVGTKSDLRMVGDTSAMKTHMEGMDLRTEIGAGHFFECSSKSERDAPTVTQVFEQVIASYVARERQSPTSNSSVSGKSSGCCIIQ